MTTDSILYGSTRIEYSIDYVPWNLTDLFT